MEEDEEPVRRWTGEVSAANFDAVVLNFSYAGKPAQAMAVAQVCYDQHGEVRNLYTCPSFAPGSRVFFDAIISRRSDLPYVWKVAAAWTRRRKPVECDLYDVYENNYQIVQLYSGCYIHSSLLNGLSDVPDKDIESEIESIEFLVGQLRVSFCKGIFYNLESSNLEKLLEDADDRVADYIRDCHNEVRDFFLFHPKVFLITKNSIVLPCSVIRLQDYYDITLPDILDEEHARYGDDDSSSYSES